MGSSFGLAGGERRRRDEELGQRDRQGNMRVARVLQNGRRLERRIDDLSAILLPRSRFRPSGQGSGHGSNQLSNSVSDQGAYSVAPARSRDTWLYSGHTLFVAITLRTEQNPFVPLGRNAPRLSEVSMDARPEGSVLVWPAESETRRARPKCYGQFSLD